ncbi:hypothetical protein [Microbacterium sp. NPDC058389]|uniref:hypothetical protein n=1 Tax=Microbacterium sp. NPDC058389 TaxID=3346475 RepID=UPI00364EEED3
MDARTGLVIGGMTAVAASVAVVCAVAMTNTAALKDSPATTVATSRILVPAASSPTTTPTPTPTVTAPPVTPNEAEVVDAPDPTEVEPPASNTYTPPLAPEPQVAPEEPAPAAAAPAAAAPAAPADVDAAIDAARAAGTWDSLRAWAEGRGWPTGRIDALIERLERAVTDRLTSGSDQQGNGTTAPPQKESGTADRSSTMQTQFAPSGQGDSQKNSHPQHPANAGSNGNGNGAVPDTKKDQSRNSPDRRD